MFLISISLNKQKITTVHHLKTHISLTHQFWLVFPQSPSCLVEINPQFSERYVNVFKLHLCLSCLLIPRVSVLVRSVVNHLCTVCKLSSVGLKGCVCCMSGVQLCSRGGWLTEPCYPPWPSAVAVLADSSQLKGPLSSMAHGELHANGS